MNRVLNKDFVMESYLNSALQSFSDVFCPALSVQSWYARESKGSLKCSFTMFSSRSLNLLPMQGIDEER
jgi:hypothetical protein